MMQNSDWLPHRKARLCRAVGAIFVLAAMVMAIVIAVAGLSPGASPVCDIEAGCVWRNQPSILLDQDVRGIVLASPAGLKTFEAYVARPDVRLGLAAVEMINLGPFAFVMLGVGLALRRLGGRGSVALPKALRWLRLSSIAAILWALMSPLYDCLLATLLSPGTPNGATVEWFIYLDKIGAGLLLALAAYTAIWAVEAGLEARRDLDGFI
ncbi:hypothetical protein S2M10_04900 [Sphingomonas sp. S2M10]|nr:hypothetical protein [Sphingomonas sp. S2M10]